MKRKDARLRIYIFYILILAPTVIWAILSLAGAAQKLDTDTGEKRNKHEIAEGTNLGNLTSELEETYNDRVPFRSVLLKMNSALNYAIEVPYQNVLLPGLTALANFAMGDEETMVAGNESGDVTGDSFSADGSGGMTTGDGSASSVSENGMTPGSENESGVTSPDSSAAQTDLTPYYETPNDGGYYPYVELAPEVIQGRDGWLFRDEVVPDYEGDTLQSEETLANICGNMQTLNNICKEKGIQLYYIALPNKSTVYPEYMPSIDHADYVALQQLEDFAHNGSYDFSFTFLNDELLAAKRNGRLYFMTDTHWNGLGAMTCEAFLHQLMGLEPIDQASLPVIEGDEIVGDLVYYTGLPVETFPADHNADYEYRTDVAVTQIRGGDDILDEFTSTAADGRTLVYVGDSYRHHILQYLNKDFAHSYFINEKYLSAEHTDILNSADILIVENVERNFYVNPDALNGVTDLIGLMG